MGFLCLLAPFCLHFGSQKWPAAGVIFTPNWSLGSPGCLFGSFGGNLGADMVKHYYFHSFSTYFGSLFGSKVFNFQSVLPGIA